MPAPQRRAAYLGDVGSAVLAELGEHGAAARTALGLGGAATRSVGTSSSSVVAGDDARLGVDPSTFPGTDHQKVQSAINHAIANGFPAVVFRRQYDITGAGPIVVEKNSWTDRRVVWLVGQGGGITKNDAGAILTANTLNMGDISCRNMRFWSTNGAGTVVFDCDKLIRLSSLGCDYRNIDRIALATGDTITNRFQSLTFIGDHIIGGTGHAFRAPRTFDVTIAYCLVEDRHGGLFTNGVDTASLQNNALRITGNVVENCLGTGPDGAPILLGACWAAVVDGNYFEANHVNTMLPDIDLHSLCGTVGHYSLELRTNHFTRSASQKAGNACSVAVGRTSTPLLSAANIADGVLFDLKTAVGGANPLGSITALGGDHSTTGRVILRAYHSSGYAGPNTNLSTPAGATAARPPAPRLYQQFFDTTLGKPIWCTAVGTRPQQSITISGGATTSGNLTIGLYLADPLVVPVTAGDTITQVRDKIAAAGTVAGWILGTFSTNRVLFTRDLPQGATLPTFDAGGTGVTQSAITLDVAAVAPTWVDATGATV